MHIPSRLAAVLLILASGAPVWAQEGGPLPDGGDTVSARVEGLRPGSLSSPNRTNRLQINHPHAFFDLGYQTLVPGPQYRAGRLWKFFFGDDYRDAWTQPVEIPVIDLDRTAGGLTLIKLGGGRQTRSLRMKGEDGKEYVLRSVNKYPERFLPEIFLGTVVENVSADETSNINPYGAFVVPPLADAAGIHHTTPLLVVIPDSPRLGEYREEFGGMVALFEMRPDENQSDAPRFGNAGNVIGTEKLFEELREDNDEHLDVRAYARARLFDMFIGDWDRHEDQWRWAEFDTPEGKRYEPVPRDRDYTFYRFGGFFARLSRLTGNEMVRRLTYFDEDIDDVYGLNLQGLPLDLRLAAPLERGDWVAEAEALRSNVTDEVIESAIYRWPAGIYDRFGEETIEALKSRRDGLPATAETYYEILAEVVDVLGSDKHEYFEVERVSDDETRLVVRRVKDGEIEGVMMTRTFRHDETKEIRLYGLGGDDLFRLTGAAEKGIRVRIIGGDGNDRVEDRSRVSRGSRLTYVHDVPGGITVMEGPQTRVALSPEPDINEYHRRMLVKNTMLPLGGLSFRTEEGWEIEGGAALALAGFEKRPYAAAHTVYGSYTTGTEVYRLGYRGQATSFIGGWDGEAHLDAGTPEGKRYFYGLGNETPDDGRLRIGGVQVRSGLSLARDLGDHFRVQAGPTIEYTRMRAAGAPGESLAATTDLRPGVGLALALDRRDTLQAPQRGIRWHNTAHLTAGTRGEAGLLARLSTRAATYLTPPAFTRVTLALRAGAAHNLGDFEYWQANTLGGGEGVRGYRSDRWAGRTAAYAGAELRMRLVNLTTYFTRGPLGVLAFTDAGRVWADGDASRKVHTGYGGGVWYAPFNMVVVAATVAFSEEDTLFGLTLGMPF